MLTYTTYSEAGGVGKTTLSANLARSHADHGHDVLVIDLDPQDGCLSYLLGVDDGRDDEDADTLVHHLIDRPRDEFDGLVRTTEGIDIVPSHNRLETLGDMLEKAAAIAEGTGESFSKYQRLRHVLMKNDVPDDYDVLIVDPPATSGPHLYNSIDATRSLVIPVELSGKGDRSIAGLESVAGGIEDTLGIDVGVLAVVPNRYEGLNDQTDVLDEVSDLGYSVPIVLRKRSSLFEGCWRKQCSAFEYVAEHRDRTRDHEMETLAKIGILASHLEERA